MPYIARYTPETLTRAQLDAMPGARLLEFGIDECPHCQAAQAGIEQALQAHPALEHVKVEDGKGRRLGRSYRVKLWPTLILLRDGLEVGRVTRPESVADVKQLLEQLE